MRFFTTGLVSALVAAVSAYTTPDYSVAPSGNAILTPGLNDLVTAGEKYTITWDPTTSGDVSLVLLRGPSTNVIPMYAIAENIGNSGSFDWTPSTDLEPDTTHYGLLLVVESGPNKGAYQWSTQFGVKNTQYGQDDKTTTETTETAAPTETAPTSSTVTEIKTITTTTCPEAEKPTASVPVIPTGSPAPSAPVVPSVIPTFTQSPSAPAWTPTFTPAPPQFTGAAGRNALSLGAVAAGVAAVLAF
ncbi:GPI anchored serine-threonine rich protein [Aspergillus stella-maris]|uniref:GPI anchored serine-threonine rich protein n=1 Tax=Aspergillus stella-maris TaxID=1810926 RepID=UPI003CCDEDD4